MHFRLLAAAVVACASAFAAPIITIECAPGKALDPKVALDGWTSFRDSLAGPDLTYENFETGPWTGGGSKPMAAGGESHGLNPTTRWYDSTITTAFGSWSAEGDVGMAGTYSSRTKELVVLKEDNNSFGGHQNTTPGGEFWLASNDMQKVVFTPAKPVYALGFLLVDPNDQGSTIEIQFDKSGVTSAFVSGKKTSGALVFVGIRSDDDPISRFIFHSTGDNACADAFGMDDFFAVTQRDDPAPVPEPGTWALAGTALLSLAALRRRK